MSYEHLDYRRDSRAGMTATEMQVAAEDRAERRQHYLAQMANVGPVPVRPRTRATYERPSISLGIGAHAFCVSWDAVGAVVPDDARDATHDEEQRRLALRIAEGRRLRRQRRGRA